MAPDADFAWFQYDAIAQSIVGTVSRLARIGSDLSISTERITAVAAMADVVQV